MALCVGLPALDDAASPPADAPLAAFRTELLDVAFETASAIRVNPFARDRARAQEAVAAACLRLDQPVKARGFAEEIDNWRRGAAWADLAFWCAQRGHPSEAQEYLTLAGQVVDETEDWRRDRIKVKIARTHALLGRSEEAERFESGVVEAETGKVAAIRASLSEDEAFDEQMSALDGLVAVGHLDVTKNALDGYAALFNRTYGSPERRTLVEEKIRGSWGNLPVFLRIELLLKLAGFALDHGDKSRALELVNDAQGLVDGAQWRVEDRIPRIAEVIKMRFRAGDAERARADAGTARSLFDAEVQTIVNIDRAGAIRPLAEAYAVMGDGAVALAVYRRVVEEGLANPNPRPRAEDLSATCCSMALHGIEPDAELWTRIGQISDGVAQPR